MLISCPKCQSVYEIPDDLIGKTGKNFRCQTCANVWHAMPEDALGYEKPHQEDLCIEPIPVTVPPYRNYPADTDPYIIPADTRPGVKIRSSKELIKQEGDPQYTPPAPKVKKKQEITLTSDYGTSFTISTAADFDEPENREPHLFGSNSGLAPTAKDRLTTEKPFKGYKKTSAFLFLVFFSLLTVLLRREIVSFYPKAETWYNQIHLTGLNNPEYLKFENITLTRATVDTSSVLKLSAVIANPSLYATNVPEITLSGSDQTYASERSFLKAKEKTVVEITLPAPQPNISQNLILGFKRP